MSADSMQNPNQFPEDGNPQEEHDKYVENPETPEVNIGSLHESVLREKVEPAEGQEPLPLWFILMFAVVLFWAGGYLLRYSGGFDSNVYDEEQIAYGPQKGGIGETKAADPIAVGKRVYTINCASCHQATGQGAPGQYPPLAGSDIVLCKDGYGENHLARIMLDGLAGQLTLSGTTYNGNMPPWAGNLKDDQIAYVLTYIRQEWGNQAGPITPDEIAAVRKAVADRSSPWSDEELKQIPATSLAPSPAATPSSGVTPPAAAGSPAAPVKK